MGSPVNAVWAGFPGEGDRVTTAVSLKDVALSAGVSIKTVSNVVNGYQHVRPEMRQRVQQVIDELGYRPNLSARSLRRGRTGVIALALPELTSPYFAELAGSIIDSAERRGWTVLVDQTDGVRERELLVLQGIRSHLIDGAIFSPLALGRDDGKTLRPEVPLVLLGERVFDGDVDHIAIDSVAAARTAVEHLVQRGRTKVAVIGAQRTRSSETARLRLKGYEQALRAAGLAEDPSLVLPAVQWHRADGANAARELLSRKLWPDAIFCCNDLLAIGAIHALQCAGVSVPDDVAVIGIDDIEEAAFATPSLTTIGPDKVAIAQLSLELLAARIGTPAAARPPQDLQVDFKLIVRDST